MDKGRTDRVKKSIISTLFLQVTTVLCGLIVPRLLLSNYGSEAYGATTSIAQFLSYITLLEGGIGGVARAALYKPLAEHDKKNISIIVYELKRFFRIIAFISIGYTIILACLFKSISHIECYDWFSSFLLVFAMAISTFGQYFIGISYSALIQADQRVFLINAVSTITTILNTVMVIVLVNLQSSLIFVKLVSSCVFLIKPTFLWLYVKKRYGLLNNVKHDKNALEQRWTGLGQHLAYYIHSNTDVAVLTFIVNLKVVSVYSVYYMITSNIQNIIVALCSGMESLFGDMIAKNEREKLSEAFNLYELLTSIVSTIFFSTVYVMIIPFISLYTKGVEDVNYIEPVFAILITTASLVYCVRYPFQSVITAAGHFKETRMGAYGEAGINLTLSILLVWKFGLVGVAIGTIVAIGFRLVYSAIYISRHILYRKVKMLIKRSFITLGCIIISSLICGLGISRVSIDDYMRWIVCAFIVVVVTAIVTMLVNAVFYRNSMIKMLKLISNRVNR